MISLPSLVVAALRAGPTLLTALAGADALEALARPSGIAETELGSLGADDTFSGPLGFVAVAAVSVVRLAVVVLRAMGALLTASAGPVATSAEALLPVFLRAALVVMTAVAGLLDLGARVSATTFFAVRSAAAAFSLDTILAPV